MSDMVRKVHNATPLHMPADFGDNETYEDYCAEAMIAAIYMKAESDEEDLIQEEKLPVNETKENLEIENKVKTDNEDGASDKDESQAEDPQIKNEGETKNY